MKKLLFFSFIFISNYCFSQVPNWIWAQQATGSESNGFDVATDGNNNVFVATYCLNSTSIGSFNVSGPAQTAFVAKYNSSGVPQWVSVFPCINGSIPEKIVVDYQNNIIMLGRFTGTLTAGSYTLIAPPASGEQFFLVKLGSAGNVLWAKQASSSMECRGRALAVDNENNVYVSGDNVTFVTFGSFTTSNERGMYILKYDPNGVPIQLLDEANCFPVSVNVNSENKIFFSGYLQDTTIIGSDTLYPTIHYEYIYNLNDTDTMVYADGGFLYICYDSLGNVLWDRHSSGKGYRWLPSSKLDDHSNLYSCGTIEDTTDFWGTTAYPAYDAGNGTAFALKIDSLGNLLWYKSGQPISPLGRSYLRDIISFDSSVFAVGWQWGASVFANLSINSTSGNANMIILKLDTAGNGLWAIIDNTNPARNAPNSITYDGNHDIIITGIFEDSVHFGNNYLNSFGNLNPIMLVAKMSSEPLEVAQINFHDIPFNIYPNPTTSTLTLETNSANLLTSINVYSADGRLLKSLVIGHLALVNVDMKDLSAGIYFLDCESEKGRERLKVVKY